MKKTLSFCSAFLIYGLFFYYVMIRSLDVSVDFGPYYIYRGVIWKGWLTTIQISLVALVLSLVVGLVIYFMGQSRFNLLRSMATIHKAIIFGTPLVVIAIVAYYYIGFAFGWDSKFWVGVFTLALYIGAYVADIYQGAIEGIHINQWQTAKMFGFSKYQTYRCVIFPQVLRNILPPLAGQFALTIKGSALLSYMSTDEFLNTIKTVQAVSFRYSEGFILVTVGYLLITVPLIYAVRLLEKKVKYN